MLILFIMYLGIIPFSKDMELLSEYVAAPVTKSEVKKVRAEEVCEEVLSRAYHIFIFHTPCYRAHWDGILLPSLNP